MSISAIQQHVMESLQHYSADCAHLLLRGWAPLPVLLSQVLSQVLSQGLSQVLLQGLFQGLSQGLSQAVLSCRAVHSQAIVDCSETPQLTPRNSTGVEPDPPLHKPPAEAASPEDQAPGSVSQPHLVSSASTGSNDSCATAAVLPPPLSEQQGEDTALATDSTPATTSTAAASGQKLPQLNAAVRNPDAVMAETPAVASTAAVAPPNGKLPVDEVSVAMSEAALLQPKATPGAAIGRAQVTDESLAHWVKLPQHRLKGRAAADKPSAEQPWQVRTHGLLRCAVLCCAALRCAAMLFSAAQPWLLLLLQSCHHCLLQAHS